MKVLFIADPMDRLKVKTDTSLYMLREFSKKGAELYWSTSENIWWMKNSVYVSGQKILDGGTPEIHPRLGIFEEQDVLEFDLVIIRKEPPFDESYQRLCWLLEPFEDRVIFSNKPSVLLHNHEKMLPLRALAGGVLSDEQVITTCVTDRAEVARQFVNDLGVENIILKPWLGHGGRDIQMLEATGFMDESDKYFKGDERWMIQPFEQEIFARGDRRVIFLGGKAIAHFVRLPKKGHFVSNLIRGGQAFLREMEPQEKELTTRLEPWLKKVGIDFAGADYINNKLSEINITSPTGLESYETLTGENLAPWIVDYLLDGRD